MIDGSGKLYGVTAYGGTGNCVLLGILGGYGTVYDFLHHSKREERGKRPSCTVSLPPNKGTSRMAT